MTQDTSSSYDIEQLSATATTSSASARVGYAGKHCMTAMPCVFPSCHPCVDFMQILRFLHVNLVSTLFQLNVNLVLVLYQFSLNC